MTTIITLFAFATILNTVLVIVGVCADWFVTDYSRYEIEGIVGCTFEDYTVPQLPEWAIESIEESETPIACPEYNPFEEQVQQIWGDAEFIAPIIELPLPAVLVNTNEEAPMVLHKGEPQIQVGDAIIVPRKTVNGYWLDSNGRVRNAKGQFAKLPVSKRKAA